MELSQILERMEQKANKPAAAAKTEKTASEDTLKQALNDLLKNAGTEKTAEAKSLSPQEALMKQAELLVGAEKQAEVEHAKMLGLAFADAAITKWAAYDAQLKHMAAQEEKAAAEGYHSTVNAAKGQPSIDQIKMAAQQGNPQAIDYLNKLAAAEYEQGQTQALNEIYKTAAHEFLKGAAETHILLEQLKAKG